MKHLSVIVGSIVLIGGASSFVALRNNLPSFKAFSTHSTSESLPLSPSPVATILSTPTPLPPSRVLNVPFVLEAPQGNWTGPWKDACEESTLTMIENYYLGNKTVDVTSATTYMQHLFEVENKLFKSNMNSNADQLVKLITDYSSFSGTIVTNPSINDIKNEIDRGYPVISLHRGSELKNSNIAFLSSGSSYHVLPIIGYDDTTREFITHDPGDRKEGEFHRYGYDLLMNSLHDYNYANYKADGPARVVFTRPVGR